MSIQSRTVANTQIYNADTKCSALELMWAMDNSMVDRSMARGDSEANVNQHNNGAHQDDVARSVVGGTPQKSEGRKRHVIPGLEILPQRYTDSPRAEAQPEAQPEEMMFAKAYL